MNGTLSSFAFNLLMLAIFAGVVYVALKIAQSVFGTGSKRAAATEVAAKLVAYPTASTGVLRRRFVRAITRQHVIMPSGERLAFSELMVRVAPEDLERLDPDGDLDRLGADAAKLYLTHARREGWITPDEVTIAVEVDPGLRSGWIPPARGTGRGEPSRPAEPQYSQIRLDQPGWDVVKPNEAQLESAVTRNFPALVPDLEDTAPTMNVVAELRLQRGSQTITVQRTGAVLGRLSESPMRFAEPEVSYRHAELRRHGGNWQIEDLGSTNGTIVDGERLTQNMRKTLHNGSVISLAGIQLVALFDDSGTVHLGTGRLEDMSRF